MVKTPRKKLPEYRAWKAMKARCYAPSNTNSTYQKNGITVCDEWLNNFEQFYLDMGDKPSLKHSLDRIDNTKGYSKENCRWATQDIQCRNRGSFNIVVEHDGKQLTLKEWANRLGIKYSTLYQRVKRSGLSFEAAIKVDPFDRIIKIGNEKKL